MGVETLFREVWPTLKQELKSLRTTLETKAQGLLGYVKNMTAHSESSASVTLDQKRHRNHNLRLGIEGTLLFAIATTALLWEQIKGNFMDLSAANGAEQKPIPAQVVLPPTGTPRNTKLPPTRMTSPTPLPTYTETATSVPPTKTRTPPPEKSKTPVPTKLPTQVAPPATPIPPEAPVPIKESDGTVRPDFILPYNCDYLGGQLWDCKTRSDIRIGKEADPHFQLSPDYVYYHDYPTDENNPPGIYYDFEFNSNGLNKIVVWTVK